MSAIRFEFDWKDVNQNVASKALAHNFNPKVWQTVALIAGGAGLAVLFDLAIMDGYGIAGLWGFLFGIYAAIGWNWLRYRRMTAGIANSPARSGGLKVTFDEKGYRVVSATTDSWAAWSNITTIKPAKGMIIIAVGTVEYLPVLDSALPNGMSREEMIARLEDFTGLKA